MAFTWRVAILVAHLMSTGSSYRGPDTSRIRAGRRGVLPRRRRTEGTATLLKSSGFQPRYLIPRTSRPGRAPVSAPCRRVTVPLTIVAS